MKNFFKFLGIVSLALVIGFSMAGCKDADDDDGGGGGGGGSVDWPADITYGTGALGKKGDYISGNLEMNIYARVSGTAQACFISGDGPEKVFVIKAVAGKKITVNDYTSDVVFCTDYTISGTTLTLTGGEGVFAPYSGITWTRK
jgi:hypothetical protein